VAGLHPLGDLSLDRGTQGRVGVVSRGADAPKKISVEKEKNDLKIEYYR